MKVNGKAVAFFPSSTLAQGKIAQNVKLANKCKKKVFVIIFSHVSLPLSLSLYR